MATAIASTVAPTARAGRVASLLGVAAGPLLSVLLLSSLSGEGASVGAVVGLSLPSASSLVPTCSLGLDEDAVSVVFKFARSFVEAVVSCAVEGVVSPVVVSSGNMSLPATMLSPSVCA